MRVWFEQILSQKGQGWSTLVPLVGALRDMDLCTHVEDTARCLGCLQGVTIPGQKEEQYILLSGPAEEN